jgi:hypothetical protein
VTNGETQTEPAYGPALEANRLIAEAGLDSEGTGAVLPEFPEAPCPSEETFRRFLVLFEGFTEQHHRAAPKIHSRQRRQALRCHGREPKQGGGYVTANVWRVEPFGSGNQVRVWCSDARLPTQSTS